MQRTHLTIVLVAVLVCATALLGIWMVTSDDDPEPGPQPCFDCFRDNR